MRQACPAPGSERGFFFKDPAPGGVAERQWHALLAFADRLR